MYWVDIIMLLALGVLGAASAIAKKKPEAKEMIDKLAKYSGYIGLVAVCWGVWDLIHALMWLSLIGAGLLGLLTWVTWVVTAAVFILLGFIFGYGMIMTYTGAKLSAEQKAKSEALRQKLIGFQVPLGYLSIIMAIWWVAFTFFLYRMFV
jgi:hypothetical protein